MKSVSKKVAKIIPGTSFMTRGVGISTHLPSLKPHESHLFPPLGFAPQFGEPEL